MRSASPFATPQTSPIFILAVTCQPHPPSHSFPSATQTHHASHIAHFALQRLRILLQRNRNAKAQRTALRQKPPHLFCRREVHDSANDDDLATFTVTSLLSADEDTEAVVGRVEGRVEGFDIFYARVSDAS
jgi:hypothetical protein